MTIQELNQQVGRSAVYVAQAIPAEVVIVDGKLAYGRVSASRFDTVLVVTKGTK